MTASVLKTKISEVENKIISVSGLVKKTDYDAKIKDIERKYFSTTDYNKFTSDILDVKIKQKELVSKSDIDKKLINVSGKITENKRKQVEFEKEITDLTNKVAQIPEKGYGFLCRMYFKDNDGYQNFPFFDPMFSSLILDSNGKVTNWISTRILSERRKKIETGLELTLNCFFGTVKLVRNKLKRQIIHNHRGIAFGVLKF